MYPFGSRLLSSLGSHLLCHELQLTIDGEHDIEAGNGFPHLVLPLRDHPPAAGSLKEQLPRLTGQHVVVGSLNSLQALIVDAHKAEYLGSQGVRGIHPFWLRQHVDAIQIEFLDFLNSLLAELAGDVGEAPLLFELGQDVNYRSIENRGQGGGGRKRVGYLLRVGIDGGRVASIVRASSRPSRS